MIRFFTTPFRVLVLIYQSVVMALAQIYTNKLRSFLTTIGIVIGVAAVVAIVSAVSGLQRKVLSEFESFGTDKLFVFPRVPDGVQRNATTFQRIRFTRNLFDNMLDHTPSVRGFTRQSDDNLNVSFNQKKVNGVKVNGIDTDWHSIERRYVTIGRPFSYVDAEQARPVVLVNKSLADQLQLDRDPSGQSIIVGERRFTVVGIVEDEPGSGLFGNDNEGAQAVVPFETMRRMNPNGRYYVIAAAKSTDRAIEASAEIEFFLRNRRGIGPLEQPNFGVEYVASFVDRFNQIATVITLVATCVVGISLLVGGVGIMNIMLVSVSERTREIGLRKAVGARPSAIMFQFLVEAVVLCVVGGLLGIACGWLLTQALRFIPGLLDDAFVPMWAVALSFGFSAMVGIVFGMFPAIKAARLDPIDALRHE